MHDDCWVSKMKKCYFNFCRALTFVAAVGRIKLELVARLKGRIAESLVFVLDTGLL